MIKFGCPLYIESRYAKFISELGKLDNALIRRIRGIDTSTSTEHWLGEQYISNKQLIEKINTHFTESVVILLSSKQTKNLESINLTNSKLSHQQYEDIFKALKYHHAPLKMVLHVLNFYDKFTEMFTHAIRISGNIYHLDLRRSKFTGDSFRNLCNFIADDARITCLKIDGCIFEQKNDIFFLPKALAKNNSIKRLKMNDIVRKKTSDVIGDIIYATKSIDCFKCQNEFTVNLMSLIHTVKALNVNTSIRHLALFRNYYRSITDYDYIRRIFSDLLQRSNFSIIHLIWPSPVPYNNGLGSLLSLLERNKANLKNRYATLFNILLPFSNDYTEDEEYYQTKKIRLK